MDIPEQKIKNPPTIDISHIKEALIKFPKNKARTYIEPCHKNKTPAAMHIPIPYAEARTVDVTKSKVAFVNKKV